MYGCKSEQSKEITELLVTLDIRRLGWRCIGGLGRDYPYDVLVDRGTGRIAQNLQRFETIQVKYIADGWKLPVCTRRNPEAEQVSTNGKNRNNNWYDDHEITYLASVSADHSIRYYHIDVYRHFDVEIDIRSVPPSGFPSTEPQRVIPSRISLPLKSNVPDLFGDNMV